jgi:hypothetical protein
LIFLKYLVVPSCQAQMAKYEGEIRFILKCKDLSYLDMVASKDAKIMNLIEGANMQARGTADVQILHLFRITARFFCFTNPIFGEFAHATPGIFIIVYCDLISYCVCVSFSRVCPEHQAVLFRHEMELDQTRKQHELELARQKEHVEGESKREIAMLNKEVQSREMMIDAFKIQTDTATRKLEEAQRQFEKQTRSLEVKEETRCGICHLTIFATQY